jgi:anti-sigma factor RsiW
MDHVSEELMYDLVDRELSPEESEEVLAHISGCKACRKTLSEIAWVEKAGRRLWDEKLSQDCPDEDTLFDYFDGRLDGKSLKALEKHLEGCPVCAAAVRMADESQKRFLALERASKELAPSIKERLKKRLGQMDIDAFLASVTEVLVPSGLGNELFGLLSRSAQVLNYPFTSPLEAPALLPVAAGGVKLADTGTGFRRKIVTEAGTPFEVELVQFGDRFIMNLKALDKDHGEALVRYSLFERDRLRQSGVILVSKGKGSVRFSPDEIESLRPEKIPLNLKIEALLRTNVILEVKTDDLLALLEHLEGLLLSENADLAIEALKKIEGLSKKNIDSPD